MAELLIPSFLPLPIAARGALAVMTADQRARDEDRRLARVAEEAGQVVQELTAAKLPEAQLEKRPHLREAIALLPVRKREAILQLSETGGQRASRRGTARLADAIEALNQTQQSILSALDNGSHTGSSPQTAGASTGGAAKGAAAKGSATPGGAAAGGAPPNS